MSHHTVISPSAAPPPRTRGGLGIALGQLALVPVLFLVGFGFFFVGMGLSPDATGDVITPRDIAVLALYGFIAVTVLVLLIGAPTLLIARRNQRARLERTAAYVPLGFAAASVVILTGLALAGFVFGQLAGI